MYNQVFNPQVQHNAESVKKIINTPAVLIISLLSFATAVLKFFAKGLILSDALHSNIGKSTTHRQAN